MFPGLCSEYYPDLARTSKVLAVMGYLRIRLTGPLTGMAALQLCPVKHMCFHCCDVWHIISGTINSSGSRLNYRPDVQLRGRQAAADSPVSLTKEKHMHMDSSLRNGGEWESLLTYCLLWETLKRQRKERYINLDVDNIKYWTLQSTLHHFCATNRNECIA